MSMPWLRAASSTRNGNFPFPAMRPYLFDDATAGCLDEVQENLDLRRLDFTADFFQGLSGIELGLQQKPESRLDVLDLFGREPLTFQPNRVHAKRMRIALADGFRIRQHVFGDDTVAADITMSADAAKRVDAGKCSNRRMVVNHNVATKRGRIRHDDVTPNSAVVGDMCVHHEEVVIADPGIPAAALCPPMHIHELTKHVL